MTNLVVTSKVIKDVEMSLDEEKSIVTFKLPVKYLKWEKSLMEDIKKYYNTFIEHVIVNYHDTYHYGDLSFERCLPLEINVNRSKAELVMSYDNNKDPEYFNRFKLEFGKRHNLIKQTDER